MGKINFILDLDQTLIHALKPNEMYRSHEDKFKKYDMDGSYIVFERPRLQEFLDFVFANFNISVWTAATQDYASWIIANIILQKPNRKLDYVFFHQHVVISEKMTSHTKALKMFWEVYKMPDYNDRNTLILDDYNEVYKTQPNNCINVKPFDFNKLGADKDDLFEKLIPILKTQLVGTNNVQKAVPIINSELKSKNESKSK